MGKKWGNLSGVSVKMLQRWNREKILKTNRTPTNKHYYSKYKNLKKGETTQKYI